jgi:hypothetical protein
MTSSPLSSRCACICCHFLDVPHRALLISLFFPCARFLQAFVRLTSYLLFSCLSHMLTTVLLTVPIASIDSPASVTMSFSSSYYTRGGSIASTRRGSTRFVFLLSHLSPTTTTPTLQLADASNGPLFLTCSTAKSPSSPTCKTRRKTPARSLPSRSGTSWLGRSERRRSRRRRRQSRCPESCIWDELCDEKLRSFRTLTARETPDAK